MKLQLFLPAILLFIFTLNPCKATHIVGGEMNYKWIGFDVPSGKNIYQIRLTMYRDCYVGVPPFDNPAIMGIFDINNNFIDSVWLPFLGLDTLPPQINDPCTIPPTNFCYEVTTYIDTIMLAPLTGGYIISYQRCCRNVNILNIVFPACTGATYWAHIPGPEMVSMDSNPTFKNWPPPFICANKPWVFDFSATDYEGDSLVYELYTPYIGLDAACPVVTTAPIAPSGTTCSPVVSVCPNFPVNPPFSTVTWAAPTYGLFNVLGGTPLAVNSATGLVTAVPSTLGYFVFGIKCKEYRNGILIGETLRDFQLIVLPCPSIASAAASVPNVICGTNTVSFTNSSITSISNAFHWDFGNTAVLNDTSNIFSPSYTYPDTGTYNYFLVAFAINTPACNDTFASTVTISDYFNGVFNFTSDPCVPNKLFFNSAVNSPAGTTATFEWNFGDSDTSQHTLQNPVHTYANVTGTYTVTLITYIPGSLNCYDTIAAQTISLGTAGSLFIPNTFTPNNDGKNDIFRVRGPSYNKFYFAVYNRWGELIWETNNVNDGWDGTFKGTQSDAGVFGWYLKAACGDGKEEFFRKGNVTLIR